MILTLEVDVNCIGEPTIQQMNQLGEAIQKAVAKHNLEFVSFKADIKFGWPQEILIPEGTEFSVR